MKRQEYRAQFDSALEKFCTAEVEKLRPLFFDSMLEEIVSYLIDYQQWWKRIRPYLVWLFGSQFGVSDEDLQDLCMAVELVHLYAIIDDDIMDKGNNKAWDAHVSQTYRGSLCSA